jgi:hypothetical protein
VKCCFLLPGNRYKLKVSGNKALRKMCGGPEKQCRIIHAIQLRDICRSPSTVGIIESVRLRWADRVISVGEKESLIHFSNFR